MKAFRPCTSAEATAMLERARAAKTPIGYLLHMIRFSWYTFPGRPGAYSGEWGR